MSFTIASTRAATKRQSVGSAIRSTRYAGQRSQGGVTSESPSPHFRFRQLSRIHTNCERRHFPGGPSNREAAQGLQDAVRTVSERAAAGTALTGVEDCANPPAARQVCVPPDHPVHAATFPGHRARPVGRAGAPSYRNGPARRRPAARPGRRTATAAPGTGAR